MVSLVLLSTIVEETNARALELLIAPYENSLVHPIEKRQTNYNEDSRSSEESNSSGESSSSEESVKTDFESNLREKRNLLHRIEEHGFSSEEGSRSINSFEEISHNFRKKRNPESSESGHDSIEE